MKNLKKRPRRPRENVSDGKQMAIRFPPALLADLSELAHQDDRDFAPYCRRVLQDHVDEKRAEKRPVYAT